MSLSGWLWHHTKWNDDAEWDVEDGAGEKFGRAYTHQQPGTQGVRSGKGKFIIFNIVCFLQFLTQVHVHILPKKPTILFLYFHDGFYTVILGID